MSIQTQRYRYIGPLSGASLRVNGKDVDVLLNPKKPVELPPEHPFTQTLLAQKRLIALPPAPVAGVENPPPPPPPPPPAPPKGKGKGDKGAAP